MCMLTAIFTLSLLTGAGFADVVSFEGDVFPENTQPPWERSGTFDCERWVDNGWFFQNVDLGDWAPPPGGEQDKYRRSLADFIGEQTFFVEWHMQTDGDSSEIDGVAPASLVASGTTGVNYHFTIADDLVRLIRDNFLPIVYVDIETGVPHIYRLELYGDELYAWYIDGELVDSGVPEGAFPTSETNGISFRSKSWFLESTTMWDYVRYGTLPIDGSGDFDSDGEVNEDDAHFFQECLLTPAGTWPGCAWADIDFSGSVDCDDWFLFLEVWTDPADPPCMPSCGDCDPADLNQDGMVGAFDLALLLGSWGPCPDPPANCPADLDDSGFVNAFDLAMLLGSWG